MDSTTAGGLGIFGIIMSAGGLLYSAINHKKFRCRCCGKVLDASIDIDPTEPVVKTKPTEPDEEMAQDKTEDTETQTPPPTPPRKKRRKSSITTETS
jgi:outer membrane biosynthesis protein TonB